MNANNTVGMLIVNHPLYGKCKNLDAIEGIKQCSGICQSSTFFDSGNNTSKLNISTVLYCNNFNLTLSFLYRKLESNE